MKTIKRLTKKIISIRKYLLLMACAFLLVNCSQKDDTEDPPVSSNVMVSTFAGSTQGYKDEMGTNAQFLYPVGICSDNNNNIYVAERNAKIRKITFNGTVSTYAGSLVGNVDGVASAARFDDPKDIAIDASGIMYVADHGNHSIRKITVAGNVSTLAGGSGLGGGFKDGVGTVAKFNCPTGLVVDAQGNVYVADWLNHRIRKITPNGVVSTFAGSTEGYADGTGPNAKFFKPYGITMDAQSNLFVTDQGNSKIRKITPNGLVSTLAGSVQGFKDGVGVEAQFLIPAGITIDSQDNLYVADVLNYKIRKITPQGLVSTMAGSVEGYLDETGEKAQFNRPYGVAIDNAGKIYVTDFLNQKIRKISKMK